MGSGIDRFVSGFMLPLVAGGSVKVDGLLGPGSLTQFLQRDTFDATLKTTLLLRMEEHTRRVGRTCAPSQLGPDSLALAIVWHNLLAMTHPDVAGRMGLRAKVVQWNDGMLQWIGPPRTAEEATQRYVSQAMLHRVGREDTTVSFWAGTATFIGIAPPPRMTAWRTVRRVQESRTRHPLFELLLQLQSDEPEFDLANDVREVLLLSPLTDIALADRPPLFQFAWSRSSINTMGDASLRSAMVRLLLGVHRPEERGTEWLAQRVRAVENATLAVNPELFPINVATVLLQFHLEALLCEAMARSSPPNTTSFPLAWDAVHRLGAERTAKITGVPMHEIERSLALDTPREPIKDAPSAALIARAMALEVER